MVFVHIVRQKVMRMKAQKLLPTLIFAFFLLASNLNRCRHWYKVNVNHGFMVQTKNGHGFRFGGKPKTDMVLFSYRNSSQILVEVVKTEEGQA